MTTRRDHRKLGGVIHSSNLYLGKNRRRNWVRFPLKTPPLQKKGNIGQWGGVFEVHRNNEVIPRRDLRQKVFLNVNE
ncbi:hypothetical protein JTE90_001278 [Oedothorax gibbosus]|uniref:Uncharacterized protein n=1 Tax=Oedothorax gibbosus TaxID=931172 RepID=A0AAV6V2D3_9ARAC|nr:hypothetical protein JTE90_001278 [Oedothorax gibbosus]